MLFATQVKAQKYIPNKVYRVNAVDRGFKGKVKSVTTKYYHKMTQDSLQKVWRQVISDSIGTGFFLTRLEEQQFDKNGLLQNFIYGYFYFENKAIDSFVNNIQGQNQITLIPSLSFKVNDSIEGKYKFINIEHQYVYDSLKRLIHVKQLNKNVTDGHEADFIYDVKGDLISSKFWENNNVLVDAYENRYDKKDSLIEVEHYNYWANEFEVQKFKYNNNKCEVFHYLNDGNLYRKEYFIFNNDGSYDYECTWTHRSRFKKRHIISKGIGLLQSLSYQYFNNDGKLINSCITLKRETDSNGNTTHLETKDQILNKIYKQSHSYNYDANGNVIKQISYNEIGEIIAESITTYEYY